MLVHRRLCQSIRDGLMRHHFKMATVSDKIMKLSEIKPLVINSETLIFKDNQFNKSSFIMYPTTKQIFAFNCDPDFITNNLSREYFPICKQISIIGPIGSIMSNFNDYDGETLKSLSYPKLYLEHSLVREVFPNWSLAVQRNEQHRNVIMTT